MAISIEKGILEFLKELEHIAEIEFSLVASLTMLLLAGVMELEVGIDL